MAFRAPKVYQSFEKRTPGFSFIIKLRGKKGLFTVDLICVLLANYSTSE